MCSRLKQESSGNRPLKVGDEIVVTIAGQPRTLKWTGFARSETLEQWTVWQPAVIHVMDFAEKNHSTGVHTWNGEPETLVAVYFKENVRVITKPATPVQERRFGHTRVPSVASGRELVEVRE